MIEMLAKADADTFGRVGGARAVVQLVETSGMDNECAASALGALDRASKTSEGSAALGMKGGVWCTG